jgi:hypothetical protein
VVGPVTADALTPQRERPLLRACCAALFAVAGSYGILAGAASARGAGFTLVLLATFVSSCGRSTLWIYSTLLLQLRGQQRMLGRLFAAEQAGHTLAAALAGIAAGAAADAGASCAALSAAFLAAGAGVALSCAAYYTRRFDASLIGGGRRGLANAAGEEGEAIEEEEEELLPLSDAPHAGGTAREAAPG